MGSFLIILLVIIFLISTQLSYNQNLNNGLQFHYMFENNTIDSSTFGRHLDTVFNITDNEENALKNIS